MYPSHVGVNGSGTKENNLIPAASLISSSGLLLLKHPAMSELRVCIFCDLGDNVPERKVASTLLNLAEVRRLGNDGEAIMVREY